MSILEISLLIVWVNITSNKLNCSKSGVEIHSAFAMHKNCPENLFLTPMRRVGQTSENPSVYETAEKVLFA